jgi:hypothetical protein
MSIAGPPSLVTIPHAGASGTHAITWSPETDEYGAQWVPAAQSALDPHVLAHATSEAYWIHVCPWPQSMLARQSMQRKPCAGALQPIETTSAVPRAHGNSRIGGTYGQRAREASAKSLAETKTRD